MQVEALMFQRVRVFWQDETGQDIVEYSLLITFIAIACMWVVAGGRPAVNQIWTGANTTITNAQTFAAGS
jgi:Flp pilus assembly pilin Flp